MNRLSSDVPRQAYRPETMHATLPTMNDTAEDVWLAGADGCPAGWVAVFTRPNGAAVSIRIVPTFAELAFGPEKPAIIAVDVPVGLPDRSPPKGRLAESAVRPLLGDRKSSVFRIPSRSAVYAGIASEPVDQRERYFHACKIARATSDDGKAFAKQGFYIFDKIVEVDTFLHAHGDCIARVYEVHPELAFWRLNGERPLTEPKKLKSRCHQPGLALRRALLIKAGVPAVAVHANPPPGAGPDDLLDALACAAIARRIHAGTAQPFPASLPRDACGLPMAIWA